MGPSSIVFVLLMLHELEAIVATVGAAWPETAVALRGVEV